jgi:hypothetical protein
MQLVQRLQLVASDGGNIVLESKGVVEVRDRGDVPGAASQRRRLESVEVAGDVGDDHFHDFRWEAAGRFACGAYVWRRITE